MGGRIVEQFDLQEVMLKRATISGSTMRGRSPEEKQAIAKSLIEKVWPLIESGMCKPTIHKVFNLSDVVKAHETLDNGDHIGKVVLSLD